MIKTIRRRQDVLQDCLNHPAVVRELYAVAGEAMEKLGKHYLGALSRYPDWVLRLSIELMETLLAVVKKLREIADLQAEMFVSEGWTEFFTMLKRELSDDYFARVQYHLGQLKFRNGVLISSQLNKGNKGSGYFLRQPSNDEGTWLTRASPRRRWRQSARRTARPGD
jgi:hypothetical protein